MVTDTAFPMEPSKQCKRRTNVHYQSEILHKIPIQDQQGSLGRHSSLGGEHTGRSHPASYFLGHLHQMKTITRSSNKSFVQIIRLKLMFLGFFCLEEEEESTLLETRMLTRPM